jgi:hypothetical protein
LWYDEERYHNYAGQYTKPTGHFTQLVWKSSSEVGFGVATRGNYTVGVALYYTAGNVIGEFQQNVQPRLPAYRNAYPDISAGGPLHLRTSTTNRVRAPPNTKRPRKEATKDPYMNNPLNAVAAASVAFQGLNQAYYPPSFNNNSFAGIGAASNPFFAGGFGGGGGGDLYGGGMFANPFGFGF